MSPKPVPPTPGRVSLALFLIVIFLGTIITPHLLSAVIDTVSFAPNQSCEQLHTPISQVREMRPGGSDHGGWAARGPRAKGRAATSHLFALVLGASGAGDSCLRLSGEDEARPALGGHPLPGRPGSRKRPFS